MNEYDRRWAEVNITPYDSFDDFIKRGLQKPNILKWVHFRPQSDLLYVPGSKELQVNFLGFFENIQEDFQYVIKKIRNDGSTILKKENSSNPGGKLDYRDYYTDVTRKIVSIVFKHDIDNFGYSFNNDSLEEQLTTRSQRVAGFHR